ncbi:MAG: hypothetical protein LBS89_08975 [Zoogloeaceae bacterium]|nr:hypothetical protein [Zoogloeaceae bacterium]
MAKPPVFDELSVARPAVLLSSVAGALIALAVLGRYVSRWRELLPEHP